MGNVYKATVLGGDVMVPKHNAKNKNIPFKATLLHSEITIRIHNIHIETLISSQKR